MNTLSTKAQHVFDLAELATGTERPGDFPSSPLITAIPTALSLLRLMAAQL